MGRETIEIRQHLLGMQPYVVLQFRPDPDDSGGIVIGVEYGGGCDDPAAGLTLALCQISDNPIAQEIYRIAAEHADAPRVRKAMTELWQSLGFPGEVASS